MVLVLHSSESLATTWPKLSGSDAKGTPFCPGWAAGQHGPGWRPRWHSRGRQEVAAEGPSGASPDGCINGPSAENLCSSRSPRGLLPREVLLGVGDTVEVSSPEQGSGCNLQAPMARNSQPRGQAAPSASTGCTPVAALRTPSDLEACPLPPPYKSLCLIYDSKLSSWTQEPIRRSS